MPSHRSLHREVFPDGEATTYHELLNIEGRIAQIRISRSRRMRRALIEVWANDSWRPVAHLAPVKPEAHLFEAFQSPETFQLERDELMRRFCLVCTAMSPAAVY